MATSSVGRASKRRGITLVEMMIVVLLIGLMAGISFPAVSSGVETLRLNSGSDSVAAFLNAASDRAERRQQPVEIVVFPAANQIAMYSVEPGFERRIDMPPGVRIAGVLPQIPGDPAAPRRILLLPGSAPPRIGIRLENRRRAARVVRLDPITGVPRVERAQ